MFESNPNVNFGINLLRAMTPKLTKICGFTNPLKCTNHCSKALAISLIENAAVPVPVKIKLAHQGHRSDL